MEELRHEVTMVGQLAPSLPVKVPDGKPNTRRAIQLAAQVLVKDPPRGSELVRRLYGLFWHDGRDISDAKVLGEALRSLGLDPQELLVKDEASARITDGWNESWRDTGQAGVPLLVRSDGTQLVGLVRESDLERFLAIS